MPGGGGGPGVPPRNPLPETQIKRFLVRLRQNLYITRAHRRRHESQNLVCSLNLTRVTLTVFVECRWRSNTKTSGRRVASRRISSLEINFVVVIVRRRRRAREGFELTRDWRTLSFSFGKSKLVVVVVRRASSSRARGIRTNEGLTYSGFQFSNKGKGQLTNS